MVTIERSDEGGGRRQEAVPGFVCRIARWRVVRSGRALGGRSTYRVNPCALWEEHPVISLLRSMC